MRTVIVCHNEETDPEHVGNWSTEHEFAADRIDGLDRYELPGALSGSEEQDRGV